MGGRPFFLPLSPLELLDPAALVRVSRRRQGHLRSVPDRSLGGLQRRNELAVVRGVENAGHSA